MLPAALRDNIFQLLHENLTSVYLGIGRTLQRFQRLYYFEGMREWVTNKVIRCIVCQRTKRTNNTLGHTNLMHSNSSVHPFDTIAIDTFGQLPQLYLGIGT